MIKEQADATEKSHVVVLHPAQHAEFVASIQPRFAERGIPLYPGFDRAVAALRRVYEYEVSRA